MKFYTTKKHPVYREGILIVKDIDGDYQVYPDLSSMAVIWGTTIEEEEIEISIKDGWIVEEEDKKSLNINEKSHYESLKRLDIEHRKLIKKLQEKLSEKTRMLIKTQ